MFNAEHSVNIFNDTTLNSITCYWSRYLLRFFRACICAKNAFYDIAIFDRPQSDATSRSRVLSVLDMSWLAVVHIRLYVTLCVACQELLEKPIVVHYGFLRRRDTVHKVGKVIDNFTKLPVSKLPVMPKCNLPTDFSLVLIRNKNALNITRITSQFCLILQLTIILTWYLIQKLDWCAFKRDKHFVDVLNRFNTKHKRSKKKLEI